MNKEATMITRLRRLVVIVAILGSLIVGGTSAAAGPLTKTAPPPSVHPADISWE